ncbi:MAG: GFA family protein [Pseudomonadota bacterium]|nr:GFA family protein [Pseudomonadota bacterium]
MILTGGCLCGAVRWRMEGAPSAVVACHCEDCRRTTGHHVACMTVDAAALPLDGAAPRWFASSETGRRGFCGTCGSNLFWTATDWDRIEIWLGSVDGPTGLTLSGHEFVGSKSDYYDIADGAPCFDRLAPEDRGFR